jgi:hypothetical protein
VDKKPTLVFDCDLLGKSGREKYTIVFHDHTDESDENNVFAANLNPQDTEGVCWQHSSLRGYLKCAVLTEQYQKPEVLRRLYGLTLHLYNKKLCTIPENGSVLLEDRNAR